MASVVACLCDDCSSLMNGFGPNDRLSHMYEFLDLLPLLNVFIDWLVSFECLM